MNPSGHRWTLPLTLSLKMASLRRKDRSPYFFACFTSPTGRRVQVSTKQTNRKKAQAFAEKLESAAKLAGEQRLGETQARKIISQIYQEVNQEPLASTTTKDFLTNWAERRKADTSPRTAQAYAQVVRDFLESLGSRSTVDISQISRMDVTKYRDAVTQRTSVATSNKHLKYLRVGLTQAVRDGFAQVNPATHVAVLKRSPNDTPKRRSFKLDELKRILAEASDEWRGMILFGLYTGQRLKDIASLLWSNVDMQRNELNFVTAKTGRAMHIPLAAPLMSYLADLPGSDDPTKPIFPQSFPLSSRPNGDSRLSQQFHSILVSIGLAKPRQKVQTGEGHAKKRTVNEVSFHSLRHTATSLLKQTGAPEAVARDIVGHDSKAVSQLYTHIDVATKRRAIEALPDISN